MKTKNHNDLLSIIRGSSDEILIQYARDAAISFKNCEIPENPNWVGIGMMIEELAYRLVIAKKQLPDGSTAWERKDGGE
jgi:hypothetical protein